MRARQDRHQPQHWVTAEFESSALAFALPGNATFADLAGTVAELGEPHRGAPICVDVRVGGGTP
jgi:hypothetical protein